MTQIGDTVRVHYTGRLADGTVFSTNAGSHPLQFTVGSDTVISGFDKAVIGMKPGESKTVKIPAKEAYGRYNNELIQEVRREEVPMDLELKVGLRLRARREDGRIATFKVVEMSESTVTLDANHPLAGKDLSLDIELIEII